MSKYVTEEGVVVETYGEKGESFMANFMEISRRHEEAQKRESEYLKEEGIAAWLPKDGWVRSLGTSFGGGQRDSDIPSAETLKVAYVYPTVLKTPDAYEPGSRIALRESKGRQTEYEVVKIVDRLNTPDHTDKFVVRRTHRKYEFDLDGDPIHEPDVDLDWSDIKEKELLFDRCVKWARSVLNRLLW